jgi:hypothetical protein
MGKEMKTQMHEMYKKGKFVGVKKKKMYEWRHEKLINNKMHGSVFSRMHWLVVIV